MKILSISTYGLVSLLALLTACGGGGGGGNGSGSAVAEVSATSLINWTWMKGSDTTFSQGSYGAKSITVATNTPQALEGATSWNEANGSLWMFGGGGIDSVTGSSGDFNDLWKFDGTNWTWINGDATINQLSNFPASFGSNPVDAAGPGARQYASSWSDSGGNLWLFGGYVRIDLAGNTAYANDMWKFNTTTKQWTWVSGANQTNQAGNYGTIKVESPSNTPGARYGAVSWRNGTDLWLFGGRGFDSSGGLTAGYLNDLWKFNTTNNQWSWVSGSDVANKLGVYGVKNQAAGSSVPGGRAGAVAWTKAGNIWLFGGAGFDATGAGDLNDLWMFDGMNWTWVSGASVKGQAGNYGVAGVVIASNMPSARRFSVAWTDDQGKFWMFGGSRSNSGTSEDLNDLWKFDGSNWVWMSGWNVTNKSGVYGTLGSPQPATFPGARDVSVSWHDVATGKLWLFGGQGRDSMGNVGYLNDLWSFMPP